MNYLKFIFFAAACPFVVSEYTVVSMPAPSFMVRELVSNLACRSIANASRASAISAGESLLNFFLPSITILSLPRVTDTESSAVLLKAASANNCLATGFASASAAKSTTATSAGEATGCGCDGEMAAGGDLVEQPTNKQTRMM